MLPTGPRRLVILTEGQFGIHDAKTAMGVIRYGQDTIVGILDSTMAGRNLREFLPAFDIPFVGRLTDVLDGRDRPDGLLIGIAPTGGKLPEAWRATILQAIDAGLDIHSGLHQFLGDDPEFAAAAEAAGTRLIDYRRPPDRMETHHRAPASGRQAGDPDGGQRLRHRGEAMDQCCRLERVPRSFLHHPLLCQCPQLVVDEWQEVASRRLIAVRDLPQHVSNVAKRFFTV